MVPYVINHKGYAASVTRNEQCIERVTGSAIELVLKSAGCTRKPDDLLSDFGCQESDQSGLGRGLVRQA